MHTTIVIPTYNERDNIALLISRIFSLGIPDLDIVVVDDSSPDDTSAAVHSLTDSLPVHLITQPNKSGIGRAYITGFDYALKNGADTIIQMDADLSHDPADIPRLLSTLENFDMVIGSRKIPGGKIIGWNFWRKFMSAGAMMLARIFLGLAIHDITSGYRAFRRQVLESIDLKTVSAGGYAFQEEILYKVNKMGFNINEIPVIFSDRIHGKSKLSWRDIIEFFIIIFKIKYVK